MRWRGRRQSSNIEDRRDGGGGFSSGGRRPGGLRIPVKAGGGGGIALLIIVLIGWLVFGINPMALLNGMDGGGSYQKRGVTPPGKAPGCLECVIRIGMTETISSRPSSRQ